MPFKLTIEQGKGRGQTFDFEADDITIGRTEENDVVLYEGGVSRQHARISFDGTRFTVSDLESANGTTLNGAKIATEVLEDGDLIGIGAVVFRFEGAEAPAQEGGGATRIVSVAQAEKEAAKKAKGGAEKPRSKENTQAAPSKLPPVNPKLVRILGAVVVLGIVGALVGVAVKGKNKHGLKPCPGMIDIGEVKGFVFGRGDVDVDCEAPKSGLKLGFNGETKTRYVLHYAPFFVKGNELAVVFNGKKVDDAPSAPNRRSTGVTVVLPDNLVKSGANEVVFQNTKGPDETWGVERVELESIGLAEADVGKALEHYRLGVRLDHDKTVAAPNLYNAWMEFRTARRYMEGLDQKPDEYRTVVDKIRDLEKELDALCKKQLFAAQHSARYDKYDQANEAYKFILAAFPGDAHPCRAQAEAGMYEEQGAEE